MYILLSDLHYIWQYINTTIHSYSVAKMDYRGAAVYLY